MRHAWNYLIAREPGRQFRGMWRLALATALNVLPAAVFGEPLLPIVVQPVSPACISSPFGPRHLAMLPLPDAFHNGVDLPAAVGQAVQAVAPGTIVRVQRKGAGGLELLIQHRGFIGVYSHLGLVAPAILEGLRSVYAGQRVGTIGRSGLTLGPHLFFAMIVGDQAVDPAKYLRLAPCNARSSTVADPRIHPSRRY